MQNLNLLTRSFVALRNKSTLQYFHFNQLSQTPFKTVDAYGTPPSIHFEQKDYSTQIRLVIANKVQQQQPMSYGMRVHLVTNNNQYLACLGDGGLKFDKLGLEQGQNKNLLTTSTWVLADRNNSILKKPITVYDDVVFKSVYSTFLVCEQDGWVTVKANAITNSALWNIMKPNACYIPDWVYLRQPMAKNMSLVTQPQQSKKDQKKPLSSFPLQVQQWLLIEDVIDIMLGYDGVYIKKRGDKVNFVIESQLQSASCDVAISQLCQKILSIPANQYLIQNYVAVNSLQKGVVAQAFCGGIRLLLKQYKNMVIALDNQAGTKGLTLQMIWSYIQPAGSVITCLVQLIKAADKLKGGALLSCIYNFMMSSTDKMVNSIYRSLFNKSVTVYIEQLQNWIYSGTIVDKYNEFMISKTDIQNDKRVNFWNEKYVLNKQMIPVFLQKDVDLILKTGKYLNVIAECQRFLHNPYKSELTKNLERYLQTNDFSEPIRNAYKWVSEQLMSFMFKDQELTTVLSSLKGFFLVEYGDMYTSFLESADSDLSEIRSKNIPTQKFENLLELSIKTSSAKSDIFNEDVFCRLENMTIFQQINSIKRLQQKKFNFDPSFRPTGQSPTYKNFEAFVLDCKIQFPLNLIINFQCLSKYQVLFRHLFWFKILQKILNDTWIALQSVKQYKIQSIRKAHLLHQRMSYYCRCMMHYLFFEVIEKNWGVLQKNLKKVQTFQDIIIFHNQFLDKCLKQSMLTNQKLSSCINSMGNSIQGFAIIRTYLFSLTTDLTSNIIDRQRHTSRRDQVFQMKKQIDRMAQQTTINKVVQGFSLSFDKTMKQLLEQMFRVLSRDRDQQSMQNLIYLLPRLDVDGFYEKRLAIQKNDMRKIM